MCVCVCVCVCVLCVSWCWALRWAGPAWHLRNHIGSAEHMFVLGALDYPAMAENRFPLPISLVPSGPYSTLHLPGPCWALPHPPSPRSLLGPTLPSISLVPAGPYPIPHLPGPFWALPHGPSPRSLLGPPQRPTPGPGLARLQSGLGCPRGLPVALPGVPHVCVVDAVSVCLLIQEIEHVLDGQGERAAPVHSAEQGLE